MYDSQYEELPDDGQLFLAPGIAAMVVRAVDASPGKTKVKLIA